MKYFSKRIVCSATILTGKHILIALTTTTATFAATLALQAIPQD